MKPPELVTRTKYASQDWFLLDPPPISEIESDLKYPKMDHLVAEGDQLFYSVRSLGSGQFLPLTHKREPVWA